MAGSRGEQLKTAGRVFQGGKALLQPQRRRAIAGPNAVVLDIETVALPMESFSASELVYLQKDDEQPGESLSKLALWPLTGRVACAGLLNPNTSAGVLLCLGDVDAEEQLNIRGSRFSLRTRRSEADILAETWDVLARFQRLVTFNGRQFDVPFITLRSAILDVKISRRDLLGPRYSAWPHCDLLDQLSFYGCTRRFCLDFVCRQFGIESSKNGKDGSVIGEMFQAGQYREIAEYCGKDCVAEAELYRIWLERLCGSGCA